MYSWKQGGKGVKDNREETPSQVLPRNDEGSEVERVRKHILPRASWKRVAVLSMWLLTCIQSLQQWERGCVSVVINCPASANLLWLFPEAIPILKCSSLTLISLVTNQNSKFYRWSLQLHFPKPPYFFYLRPSTYSLAHQFPSLWVYLFPPLPCIRIVTNDGMQLATIISYGVALLGSMASLEWAWP